MTTLNAAEVGTAWRNLVIAGPKDRIDHLLAHIEQALPPEWERNTAAERRAASLGVSLPSSRCYRRKLAGRDVWLWLLRVGDHRVQGGLVAPTEQSNYVGDVTDAIHDFQTRVLVPAAAAAGLSLGRNRLGPQSWVSGSVIDSLWSFCDASRFTWPPTGEAARRWREFVGRAYEDHSAFDRDEFRLWLTEKGWTGSEAEALIDQFFADIALLDAHDDIHQPA